VERREITSTQSWTTKKREEVEEWDVEVRVEFKNTSAWALLELLPLVCVACLRLRRI
jgi:hypothetical protein